jgi:hypothetical protein
LLKVERRNAAEDIEHFLDKSKQYYRKWAFCCVNLTLACHACNLEKGNRDLGGPASHLALEYPSGPTAFQWIHPHFDDFHENIEVSAGWTYTIRPDAPAPTQAHQLVHDLKLAEIQRIEAYAEQIKAKVLRLTQLASLCLERGQVGRAKRLLSASIAFQQESTFG